MNMPNTMQKNVSRRRMSMASACGAGLGARAGCGFCGLRATVLDMASALFLAHGKAECAHERWGRIVLIAGVDIRFHGKAWPQLAGRGNVCGHFDAHGNALGDFGEIAGGGNEYCEPDAGAIDCTTPSTFLPSIESMVSD